MIGLLGTLHGLPIFSVCQTLPVLGWCLPRRPCRAEQKHINVHAKGVHRTRRRACRGRPAGRGSCARACNTTSSTSTRVWQRRRSKRWHGPCWLASSFASRLPSLARLSLPLGASSSTGALPASHRCTFASGVCWQRTQDTQHSDHVWTCARATVNTQLGSSLPTIDGATALLNVCWRAAVCSSLQAVASEVPAV